MAKNDNYTQTYSLCNNTNTRVNCKNGPPPAGKGGDSQAKVWGNYFLTVPTVQGK